MDWRDAKLGGQVNPGWVPLVNELHRRLLEIDPDIEVVQVKEKFGQLRYYADFCVSEASADVDVHLPMKRPRKAPVAIRELIAEAETASGWICEVCGKPGHTDNWGHGWLNTLCEEHGEQRRTTGTPAWKIAADLQAV